MCRFHKSIAAKLVIKGSKRVDTIQLIVVALLIVTVLIAYVGVPYVLSREKKVTSK